MKKTVFIVLALMVVAVLAAQGMRGMHAGKQMNCNEEHQGRMGHMERRGNGHNGNMMMRIMKELELTDTQQDELEELRITRHKDNIAAKAAIETKEVDMNVARKDMNFKEMKKLSSEISDLKKDMKLEQINHMQKCWEVLTPEQQEQAKELMDKAPMERRMERMKGEDGEGKGMGQRNQQRRMWDEE